MKRKTNPPITGHAGITITREYEKRDDGLEFFSDAANEALNHPFTGHAGITTTREYEKRGSGPKVK